MHQSAGAKYGITNHHPLLLRRSVPVPLEALLLLRALFCPLLASATFYTTSILCASLFFVLLLLLQALLL
jgi:hypothetical protein